MYLCVCVMSRYVLYTCRLYYIVVAAPEAQSVLSRVVDHLMGARGLIANLCGEPAETNGKPVAAAILLPI